MRMCLTLDGDVRRDYDLDLGELQYFTTLK